MTEETHIDEGLNGGGWSPGARIHIVRPTRPSTDDPWELTGEDIIAHVPVTDEILTANKGYLPVRQLTTDDRPVLRKGHVVARIESIEAFGWHPKMLKHGDVLIRREIRPEHLRFPAPKPFPRLGNESLQAAYQRAQDLMTEDYQRLRKAFGPDVEPR